MPDSTGKPLQKPLFLRGQTLPNRDSMVGSPRCASDESHDGMSSPCVRSSSASFLAVRANSALALGPRHEDTHEDDVTSPVSSIAAVASSSRQSLRRHFSFGHVKAPREAWSGPPKDNGSFASEIAGCTDAKSYDSHISSGSVASRHRQAARTKLSEEDKISLRHAVQRSVVPMRTLSQNRKSLSPQGVNPRTGTKQSAHSRRSSKCPLRASGTSTGDFRESSPLPRQQSKRNEDCSSSDEAVDAPIAQRMASGSLISTALRGMSSRIIENGQATRLRGPLVERVGSKGSAASQGSVEPEVSPSASPIGLEAASRRLHSSALVPVLPHGEFKVVPLNSEPSVQKQMRSSALAPVVAGADLKVVLQMPVPSRRNQCCQSCEQFGKSLSVWCKAVIRSRALQTLMFFCIIAALLMPDLWVIAEMSDNTALDIVLTLVLIMFLLELVVNTIGETRKNLNFIMLCLQSLGIATVMLELSYVPLLAPSEGQGSSSVVLRFGRLTRLVTRTGRLTRLVTLLSFSQLSRFSKHSTGATLSSHDPCRVLSKRLTTRIYVHISCLMLFMVVIVTIMGMFSNMHDFSMESWLIALEATAISCPESFEIQLQEFVLFYEHIGWRPWLLHAKNASALPALTLASLPWRSSVGPSKRLASLVRRESRHLEAYFDFQQTLVVDSIMNLILLAFVMALLIIFLCLLSNAVSRLVLQPLESLLEKVRMLASTIANSVRNMADTMLYDSEIQSNDEDGENGSAETHLFGKETVVLRRVLFVIAELRTRASAELNYEALEGLDEGDRAVVFGFQGYGGEVVSEMELDNSNIELNQEEMLEAQSAMLETSGLSLDLIDSLDLNPLVLDKARCHAAAMYFLAMHHHGINHDPVSMRYFLEAAEAGYTKAPYHNWFHAVDVTHFVLQLFQRCSVEAYFSSVDRFGLLTAAICHDIGHQGVNNAFLTETEHELALLYNDKSPLEMMHAAKLFEIVSVPKCSIFAWLAPRKQFKEIRKVIVDSILHTDNAQHFVMIKEVEMLYEVHSDILQGIDVSHEDVASFPSPPVAEVFRTSDIRHQLTSLWLHLADLSNAMKPFRISRIWAWNVLDEFFSQGDQEKTLGVPVQALNDREKVNPPFSQVGFIEFLVSPLLAAVVRVLPPTIVHAHELYVNAKTWHEIWVDETCPTPSESEQRAAVERLTKLGKRLFSHSS
eukprot:TRINITY_DN28525_c0_g1_i1.p1 TRINITY_DN28525_c0_g1~~TRINITY_DN28525_c0_g1_i1.p1  ORF type:complete len:1190 (+),score=141.67 TRINITY_DN28525_c0_g1_i1:167-3736(+)